MFSIHRIRNLRPSWEPFSTIPLMTLVLVLVTAGIPGLMAQDQSAPATNGQKQDAPPEAGGPTTDVGPYAIPKKREEPPPPPPPAKPKKVEGMADYSIKVDVPLVNVDVLVTTKDGQFIPGLKKDNFRVVEDGVQQSVTNFDISQAPITAVLLVEFASTNYYFMFDALNDTLDRVDQIEGRKYVILVTTGVDTFSKLNLDQITKKIKATHDVTIFPISVGFAVREYCETHHCGYTT